MLLLLVACEPDLQDTTFQDGNYRFTVIENSHITYTEAITSYTHPIPNMYILQDALGRATTAQISDGQSVIIKDTRVK